MQKENPLGVESLPGGEFLGREAELGIINNLYDKLVRGEPIDQDYPLKEFYSPVPGMGKSALLAEAGRLAEAKGLSVISIDFSASSFRDSLEEQRVSIDQPKVLIFDNIERISDEEGQPPNWFEDHLLANLETGKVAAIVSDNWWQRWKIFELRRRIEPIRLGSLTRKEVDDNEVYVLSFGHPGLRQRLKENPENQPQIVGDFISEVFSKTVPEEYEYTIPLMREVCSLLRKFNPTPLRPFTEAFLEEYPHKQTGFYLDAIRDMQETNLVEWSSQAGGYVLEPVLREITAAHLARTDPDEFARRHTVAASLYNDWIDQYPRNAVGFLVERIFHLVSSGVAKETIIEEANKTLGNLEENPDVQWDLPDMASSLIEQLGSDVELAELLGEETYQRLLDISRDFQDRYLL